MKEKKKKITKIIIIKICLELINEKEGSKFITIRELAKRINCSHPNIYNYYKSLDELLWDCLETVMKTMIQTVMEKTLSTKNSESKLKIFVNELLSFYLENKGWYFLVWFDHINGEMPANVKTTINLPRIEFCNFLTELYPNHDISNIIEDITDLVHSYIHSQVSNYFTGRNKITDIEFLRTKIINTSYEITELFVNSKGKRKA